MAMAISGSYSINPYNQYSSYKTPAMKDEELRDSEENQAAQLSEELVAAASLQSNNVEPQKDVPRTIDAANGADEFRNDSMNRKHSSVQMDMLDIQAAFFGFSSKRAADIPIVSSVTG